MSYGAQGAPKGYSNPRGPVADAAVWCQKCGSKQHYTYACTVPASNTYASRPSRTQMLKRGIKPQLTAVQSTKTSREEFEEELKVRAAMLEAELRAEAGLPPITGPALLGAKEEVEVDDIKAEDVDEPAVQVKTEPMSDDHERDTKADARKRSSSRVKSEAREGHVHHTRHRRSQSRNDDDGGHHRSHSRDRARSAARSPAAKANRPEVLDADARAVDRL